MNKIKLIICAENVGKFKHIAPNLNVKNIFVLIVAKKWSIGVLRKLMKTQGK